LLAVLAIDIAAVIMRITPLSKAQTNVEPVASIL